MLQYKCDDQGGPQPNPPGGWKPEDKPVEPKKDELQENEKEDKQ